MNSDNELDTTVDEWQAEMDKLSEGDPGMTLSELMKELGLKKTTMQERLKELVATGRCIRGIGRRIGVGGVYPVAVYQLKKEKR